jgi:hypothetical protein
MANASNRDTNNAIKKSTDNRYIWDWWKPYLDSYTTYYYFFAEEFFTGIHGGDTTLTGNWNDSTTVTNTRSWRGKSKCGSISRELSTYCLSPYLKALDILYCLTWGRIGLYLRPRVRWVGFLNPGYTSVGSKMLTSANFGGCGHLATPPAVTWCYVKVSTNLLTESICRNQEVSPNPMFSSPHVVVKVGFRDMWHHQH